MSVSASDRRTAEFLDIGPIERMLGTLRLPGSKSISNRSLLLAALAQGTTELTGLLDADDVDRMREALGTLGVRIEGDGETAIVHGVAGAFPVRRASLFLGNAGTAFRPTCRAHRACTSDRSAIWSTRCVRSGPTFATPAPPASRR
jgi:5-enolpyruvylshikimate-3-phosphate synthase